MVFWRDDHRIKWHGESHVWFEDRWMVTS
jgi:hypothetical protein